MNSAKTPLAVRRAHLVAQCAAERGDLADGLNLLKVPAERAGHAGEFLFAHRKSVLTGAGVALGLLIARPKRALALAAAGVSAWKMVQAALPTVQRVLPMIRARVGGHLE